MSWKRRLFENFKLYAVTDLKDENESIYKKIDDAYRGGADIVQLRAKHLSDACLYRLGKKIRLIADKNKKLFFMNDRLDIALSVSADGLHLGQEDLPVAAVRRILRVSGLHLWLGKSTHNPEQGRKAELEDVDYLGVGPIFKTPTKPGYKPAGFAYLRYAAKNFKKPFVAIGGINTDNINLVLGAGAKRVAVVRALFKARDTYENAKKLKEKINKIKN